MEFNASDVDQGPEKSYDLSPAIHICGGDGTGFGLLIPARALLIFSKCLLQVKVTANGILSPSPLRASHLPCQFSLGGEGDLGYGIRPMGAHHECPLQHVPFAFKSNFHTSTSTPASVGSSCSPLWHPGYRRVKSCSSSLRPH